MSDNSVSTKLQELFDLFNSGALSQEEYNQLKSEILNAGSTPSTKPKETTAQPSRQKDIGYQPNFQNEVRKVVLEDKFESDPLNTNCQIPDATVGDQNIRTEIEELDNARSRKKTKNRIIAIVSVVILAIGIAASVYAYQYFGEERAFESAKLENTIIAYQNYLEKYPNGKYFKEAHLIIRREIKKYALNKTKNQYNDEYEQLVLPYYSDLVQRDNSKLSIKLDNGKFEYFTNKPFQEDYSNREDEEGGEKYLFVELIIPINIYSIKQDFIFRNKEYSGYILMNKSNGKQNIISSEPIFSPNNKRFVSFDFDKWGGYTLSIDRIGENNEVVNEKYLNFSSISEDNIKWVNDNEIQLEAAIDDDYNLQTVKYKLTNNAWQEVK